MTLRAAAATPVGGRSSLQMIPHVRQATSAQLASRAEAADRAPRARHAGPPSAGRELPATSRRETLAMTQRTCKDCKASHDRGEADTAAARSNRETNVPIISREIASTLFRPGGATID